MSFVLEISTALDCPMRCDFCAQDRIRAAYRGPRLMSLDTFRRALSHCPPRCLVSFAGFAEPYLNPQCSRMIEETAALGHPIQMYSTGVGMSLWDVGVLIQARPQFVTLHLPDAEGVMDYTPTPEYVEVVTALADSDLDVRAMTMGTLHPMLSIRFGRLRAQEMQSRAGNVGGFTKINKRGPLRCQPAPELDHPVLIPDGRVTLCCQTYSLEHVVGNLAEQKWEEIAAGPELTEVRRRMASEGESVLCRQCCYSESLS